MDQKSNRINKIMGIVGFLDPVRMFGGSQGYLMFWHHLFTGVFTGILAKILSFMALILGFWFLSKRENLPAFVALLILSFAFAYVGGFIHLFH